MKAARVSALALVLVAASVDWQPATLAQNAQATPQAPPVFRSGIDLVRMDVRVVDREGRPVTDLKPEDLEVVEGGRVRPIALFQHVAEPSGTYLDVARRTIGADISTNRGAPRGHLYVIVFDQSHITPGNEQRARMAAERFLRLRVRPGDRVALYALPGPGPHVPFTSDTRAILSQLIAVRGTLDKESFGTMGGMTLYEAFQITRGNVRSFERPACGDSECAIRIGDRSNANEPPARRAPRQRPDRRRSRRRRDAGVSHLIRRRPPGLRRD
jgi:VWFA-related protein